MKKIHIENLWVKVLFSLFIIALISFILTPFNGDVRVFFGVSRQIEVSDGNWFYNVLSTWEIKGFLLRMFFSILYKISTLFVNFGDYQFEVFTKFLYSIFIMGCLFWSAKLFPYIAKKKEMFFVLGITIFGSHGWCHMQAEMTSIVLFILAIALFFNGIFHCKYIFIKSIISGILVGCSFFLKSAVILMAFCIVAVVLLLGVYFNCDRKKVYKYILISGFSCLSFLLIMLGIIYTVYPTEIQNMLDASYFQNTLLTYKDNYFVLGKIKTLILTYLKCIFYIPSLLLGLVLIFINFDYFVLKKAWKIICCQILMWLIPTLFIVISNCYFGYHYFLFLLPIFIEILLFLDRKNEYGKSIFGIAFLAAGILYISTFSIFSKGLYFCVNECRQVYQYNNKYLSNIVNSRIKDILYLDDGHAGYVFGKKSYLRWMYPLPLQRLDEKSHVRVWKEAKDKADNYRGKYVIVYENWFFNGKNKSLENKIKTEYKIIGKMGVYALSPTAYKKNATGIRYYDIYEKI